MLTLIHAQELLIENLRRIELSYSGPLGGRKARATRAALVRFHTNAMGCGLTHEQSNIAAHDAVEMMKLESIAA